MPDETINTTLIARVRALAGGAAQNTEITDNAIDAELARNRMRHIDTVLQWDPQIGSGGTLQYLEGVAGVWGIVEPCSDTARGPGTHLIDGHGNDIAGWTMSEDGRISFTTNQASVGSHFLTCYSYDIYATAAEVCLWMANNRALQFDFKVGAADEFKVSQAVERLRAMSDELRARSLPRRAVLVRSDIPRIPRGRPGHMTRSRGGNDK